MNADLSKKILKAARRQQAELEDAEEGPSPAKHVTLPPTFRGEMAKTYLKEVLNKIKLVKILKHLIYQC